MTANVDLQQVNERAMLRGFKNLLHKENLAWWGTRRWWINALLWPVLICGLLANMLFVPSIANLATEADIARAGGLTNHILLMGLSAFFEFGIIALAIGTVILSQDLLISEKQNGIAEWLLSKPIARQSYVLAKLFSNALPILILMIGLPSALGYSMLSVRMGGMFPLIPFLSGVGIMTLHTIFYLTLTLFLGTVFDNRAPILGIALGSVLGGNLLAGFFKPLLYVTPWTLPKLASLTAASQPLPVELGIFPLIATIIWCLVFVFAAIIKFEKTDF
jgi:ABC-2 type transport system permease protein